jgi:hypothetical protein
MAAVKTPKARQAAAKKEKQGSTVAEIYAEVIKNKKDSVDIREIADHFMRIVGGPSGFAKMLIRDLRTAKAGSASRARLFDIGFRLIKDVSSSQVDGDLGAMTDDDLMESASRLVGRMKMSLLTWRECSDGDGI